MTSAPTSGIVLAHTNAFTIDLSDTIDADSMIVLNRALSPTVNCGVVLDGKSLIVTPDRDDALATATINASAVSDGKTQDLTYVVNILPHAPQKVTFVIPSTSEPVVVKLGQWFDTASLPMGQASVEQEGMGTWSLDGGSLVFAPTPGYVKAADAEDAARVTVFGEKDSELVVMDFVAGTH